MNADEIAKRGSGLAAAALDRLLPSRATGTVGVLTYHRTAPFTGIDRGDSLNVPPEVFGRQLSGLQRRGLDFIDVRTLIAWLEDGSPLPPRPVLVTFDDGYAATALLAEPVLADLGIPATMFVNTAYLDSSEPFPFDPNGGAYDETVPGEYYRPLTKAELAGVIDRGVITVGAHTHTHDDFVANPERFQPDVTTNLDILRHDFGLTHVPFAFPYGVVRLGYAGGALSRQVEGLGVSCAFSTEPVLLDRTSDRYCLGRFSAYAWDTPRTLEAKLNGWYGWIESAQTMLRRN